MTNKGVAALLGGLGSVLIFEELQLNLQGVEDRMVFVHRSVATVTILTESEDSVPPPPHCGGRRHPPVSPPQTIPGQVPQAFADPALASDTFPHTMPQPSQLPWISP